MECDHVIARANGGGDNIENLMTACRTCNIGKGVQDAFTQFTRNDVPENLRGVPPRLRHLWVFSGRCEECYRKVSTEEIEAWGAETFCIDCANARVARGLRP